MSDYHLTWITNHLAVGHAPMSYAELESLKSQGIDGIVNLCGEFCDLHQIEESSGFEVYYLPIADEEAPELPEMEEGLAWLDEAIYLGKKILVHCRHGIGRTGTFVTAYLLRRGFTMKQASKMLKTKDTRANPTNFPQWWLLRKFGKKEGSLTLQEPNPENRQSDDLEPFFTRYEQLLKRVDNVVGDGASCCSNSCSTEPAACSTCTGRIELELIEALYLHSKVNITLKTETRTKLINQATAATAVHEIRTDANALINSSENITAPSCPLYQGTACLLHSYRPISCRLRGKAIAPETVAAIRDDLGQLSQEIFTAVFGPGSDHPPPPVPLGDVVSGRFIQNYFKYLTAQKNGYTS